MATPNIVVH